MTDQFVPCGPGEDHSRGAVPNDNRVGSTRAWYPSIRMLRPMFERVVDWTSSWVRRRAPATVLRAGARSAQCEYRPDNEDAFYSDGEVGLFVVADGVGGNRGGKTAAHCVIDAFATVFHELPRYASVDPLAVKHGIERSLDLAQARMTELSQGNLAFERMASTMAVAVVCDGTMFISHVGDSGVYQCGRRGIARITADDAYARAQQQRRASLPSDIESHSTRNVLLATVNGVAPVDSVPMIIRYLAPGERILLATDGLTRVVEEQELCRILQVAPTAQEAADALVRRALELDTHDNTTCVVVERLSARDLREAAEARLYRLGYGRAALEAA